MALFSRKASAGTDTSAAKERASSRSGRTPSDPALEQKKRARRRLIGAIALVIGAIIFVPMFFDSEPRPLSRDIAIQIPEKKDAAPLKPSSSEPAAPTPSPAPAASVPAPAVSPPASPPSASPALPPKEKESHTSPAPVPAREKEAKPPQPKAEAKPPVKPAVVEPPRTQVSEAQRAHSILNGHEPGKAESFAVQLGAYSSPEKAEETRRKLTQAGWKSFTVTANTAEGVRIRVRTGPYPSREAAEKAREKLKALGFEAALVGA